ncbi:hypothetical protein [uncultured Faecalicoccus sp.]|uniref:hypothetical protein n=1 Tax=uncultured Faecalicoccus sp. TaxID=1971760 RepID=UPI0025902B3F|nr:hypothetical protein [uncultured Faecalicoccus sp.]
MKVNKENIVQDLIKYIEKEEQDFQGSRMTDESKVTKTEIVNRILAELEKEMNNED